jgi:hypothetical protein
LKEAQSGPGLLNSQAGSRAHFLMIAIKTSGKKNTCIEHWHDGTGFVCMLLLWVHMKGIRRQSFLSSAIQQ